MTTRRLGSGLLLALVAAPLCGIACGEERNFTEPVGGSGAIPGGGGEDAEGGGGNASGGSSRGGTTATGATGGDAGEGPGPGEGGGAGEGSGETSWSCVAGELEETVSGTTADAGNHFAASCGSGTSPDVAYRFVAPSAGYYSFDTLGSAFDTVLSVFSSCQGRELACNRNTAGLPQAEVVVKLARDEEVLVVVDGHAGDQGSFTLNAAPVTCPSQDLTGQPFPVDLTTTGQPSDFHPTCGNATLPAPERTLRWVPETDGLYRFSVTSNAFGPALSVFEGAKCGGTLLQCSYNVVSAHPAQVTRRLKAGEPITLVVDARDGASGPFTLNMEKLTDTCPALPVLSQDKTDVVLNDDNGTKILSSSCAWAGNMLSGVPQHYEEHIYPITIPATGFIHCTYTVETDIDAFVAYLLRGNDCGGEELQCLTSGNEVTFDFTPKDAGDYLLVIENDASFPGVSVTYDVIKNCY